MPSNEGSPGTGESSTGKRSLGAALVVEDNIMIALEIDAHLRGVGASNCFLAGSVENALTILETRDIAFAIVDVNLGTGTSEGVATVLRDRALPFIFVTGYGDDIPLKERFIGVPVLIKPFPSAALTQALEQLGVLL